ncbi:MAG TPA: T9SS type A sorting domain-containing protein [Chitinophagales bacterium]|nr:T9SS type A sorting domain-containing protein [Chitinophagales bacterium]
MASILLAICGTIFKSFLTPFQVQLVSNEISGQLLSRSIDTAILYLESSDLLEDKKLLAELYLSVGRLDDCRKIVDNVVDASGWQRAELLNENDISDYEIENNEFVELLNLLLAVFESGRSLEQATELETALLEKLSNSKTVVGPKACAYLKQATGKECSYEILSDESEDEIEKRLAAPTEDFFLTLYPNPTNNLITLKANITDEFTHPEYYVYDVAGNLLLMGNLLSGLNEVVIDAKDFSEGLYILQLKNLNAIIQARKFSVLK